MTISAQTRLVSLMFALFFASASTFAQDVPEAGSGPALPAVSNVLFLEVFLNAESTDLVAEFGQDANGRLTATVQELSEVGIAADEALADADGQVALDALDGIGYEVDMVSQRLYVTVDKLDARALREIDVGPEAPEKPAPKAGLGAVLNYSLFASSNDLNKGEREPFQGLSGGFDARFFSPLGTLNQSFTANLSNQGRVEGFRRLETSYSYSDPERMITYRAGDMTTGGLGWTRPVFLGGIQVQRNFALRSDLVTLPSPDFSGTAAVPSTLDVYSNNVRTYTGNVPTGPFSLNNLPVVTGAGETRVVLRDTLGRETTATLASYSSSRMLRQGLLDFSAELGFARRNFGLESNDYDDRPMGSLSARYGLTNWLTLEAHAEGGEDLVNGGLGVVFPLGRFGVATFAGAGSQHAGRTGALVDASIELSHRDYTFFGRIQRAFGEYDDIASVTADLDSLPPFDPLVPRIYSARVPREINQVALSVPLPVERSSLSLAFTRIARDEEDDNRIGSVSFNTTLFGRTTFFASAFKDFGQDDSVGVYAGLSIPFGRDITATSAVEHSSAGTVGVVDVVKSEQIEAGSVGWRLRTAEGENPNRSASASYRSQFARFEGGVQQNDGAVRVSGQVDGAIVAAGGGIFAANRINDAFAVVDVGAPDVDVAFQNRNTARTGRSGKVLITDLNAYEPNRISIDPRNLPVDAAAPLTSEVVVPADRSGVVVNFGVDRESAAAIVTLLDQAGAPLPVGSTGKGPDGEEFVIGYDGEAYISGLAGQNTVSVNRADGSVCQAQFAYRPQAGQQIKVGSVPCL